MLLPAGGEKLEHAYPVEKVRDKLRVCNPSIPPSAVMIRRMTLLAAGGFDALQKGCEDWDLWFRLSRIGSFCVVEEPVTTYLLTNTGLSSNADRMFMDFERMLDRLLISDLHGLKRVLWRRRILAYQTYKAALTARGSQEHDKECGYFVRSVAYWPSPFWCPGRFAAFAVTLLRRIKGFAGQAVAK